MKSYFRKFSGLAIFVFFNNAALARDSFIEDEENFYRAAVQRQLVAPKTDLLNQANQDKKTIKFVLTVYGEYFGSSGILASLDYYIYLKKLDLEDSEEFRLVQSSIKAWGRKSALTIVANSEHFSGLDRDNAFQIGRDIEGDKWEDFQKDMLYAKTASFWNEASQSKQIVGDGSSIALIEKIRVNGDGELTVALDNERFIEAKGGRATITSGQLASCDMSFFTDLPVMQIRTARYSGAIAIDNGFGKKLIAWRENTRDGMVQVIRGRNQNNGVELLVLKVTGLERPSLGASVTQLSDDDLSILAMRGSAVVDEYARKLDYNNPVSFGRFGSRLDATQIQKMLIEKSGDITDLKPFLMIYANILPQLPDNFEYQSYNDLLQRYK